MDFIIIIIAVSWPIVLYALGRLGLNAVNILLVVAIIFYPAARYVMKSLGVEGDALLFSTLVVCAVSAVLIGWFNSERRGRSK